MRSIGYGLSFCGIHTDELNISLNNNDASMHALGDDLTYISENIDSFDGAYPLGSTATTRNFELQFLCDDLTDGELVRIGNVFKRDTTGILIFDHRPYKYYNATVTSEVTPPPYAIYDATQSMWIYSGILKVSLTAFVPRSYLDAEVAAAYPTVGDMLNTVNSGTAVISSNVRPAVTYTNMSGSNNSILLLNQGTASSKCDVIVTGTGLNCGIVVTNNTTGNVFTLTGEDASEHTYKVSAFYGRTVKIVDTVESMADNRKIGDFIELEPSVYAERDISATCTIDSKVIVVDCETRADMVGRHILINGVWNKITAVTSTTVTIENAASVSTTYTGCIIVKMNEMSIDCGTATVSSISFVYPDTFY